MVVLFYAQNQKCFGGNPTTTVKLPHRHPHVNSGRFTPPPHVAATSSPAATSSLISASRDVPMTAVESQGDVTQIRRISRFRISPPTLPPLAAFLQLPATSVGQNCVRRLTLRCVSLHPHRRISCWCHILGHLQHEILWCLF